MNIFTQPILQLNEYQTIKTRMNEGRLPVVLTGLSAIHKSGFISAFCEDLKRPGLIIAADEAEALRVGADLSEMGCAAAVFPSRDLVFRKTEGYSKEYEQERIAVLTKILSKKIAAVVTTVDALVQYTIPKSVLQENTFALKEGEEVSLKTVTERLVHAGYTRCGQVEGIGQFALRGGILDIFPAGSGEPYRLEFFGDEIDSVSTFDRLTQRRKTAQKKVTVTPANEVLIQNTGEFTDTLTEFANKKPGGKLKNSILSDIQQLKDGIRMTNMDRYMPLVYPTPKTLFDYFENPLVFISENTKVKEKLKVFLWRQNEDIVSFFEEGILCKGLDKFALSESEFLSEITERKGIFLEAFISGSYMVKTGEPFYLNLKRIPKWNGSLTQLIEDIGPEVSRGYAALILAASEKNAKILISDLNEKGFSASFQKAPERLIPKHILVTVGRLSDGYEIPEGKTLLVTHSLVVNKKQKLKKSDKVRKAISSFEELARGDYVVHSAHGIGIFDGIHNITTQGVKKDYIKIQYAKKDVLYVPVTQLDLVSKYIGSKDDAKIKLHKLGGAEWQKSKQRVKSALKDMAKQLTALYAKRAAIKGFAFCNDTEFQADFEARFEYEETDDQLKCIEEIKKDMERPFPMDRLLCGDVGFGKTEVALRAAFKCMVEGKQCAFLVPTTILAFQHYNTIIKRFESFPVTAGQLSRFVPQKAQAKTLKDLKNGSMDIVVGTHRLISKDVQFKDLGLLIIDEEQRFGVAQKEKLKELFPDVDVLTLSATPIPRTLNMAMSGIRDMSLIEEAPGDRHPVQTYVLEYDFGVVIDAITREVRRGGQVYYVYNNIETIEKVAVKIRQALPDARIGIAHGRMNDDELSKIWKSLLENELDILVSTTIIETGVDVPNANTLIVENADHMGLAQLYQLRGRVGRSSRRAYAYLTFRRGKALSETATGRLNAIREFTEFGSGFKIALRDLEIRGAGNILGAEQHGNMEAVGYDLYLKMLDEAVREEKGITDQKTEKECLIDLQLEAHIPEEYIENLQQRLTVYRKIAEVKTEEDARDVIDELIDRFGEPPKAVMGLIDIALLRATAAGLGIFEIGQAERNVLLYPEKLDMQAAAGFVKSLKGRVLVNAGAKPYYAVKALPGQPVIDLLKEALCSLQKSVNEV